MTYRELYLLAKRRLTAAVEFPGPDALALTRHFFGLDRTGLALHGEEAADPGTEAAFLLAVTQRADRRPLQYILGHWDFMGLSLSVGEGVLCPREDTAVLVEALARELKDCPSPKGFDLCAGTGAVGLGLCSLLPQGEAVCVELSEKALAYLRKNIASYPQYHTAAVRGDVLSPETPQKLASLFGGAFCDFIAANPPYVPAEEISDLQPEVQNEPFFALSGGQDGLVFYRAIAELWASCLKPGGILAVEIGEEQGPAVSAIFQSQGLTDIRIKQDWAGLDRVVLAKRSGEP